MLDSGRDATPSMESELPAGGKPWSRLSLEIEKKSKPVRKPNVRQRNARIGREKTTNETDRPVMLE